MLNYNSQGAAINIGGWQNVVSKTTKRWAVIDEMGVKRYTPYIIESKL